ncbi:MAG: hypothetical protein ACOH2V_00365 [Candidatus Saccharimonadaceae bacterium]
MNRTDQIDLLLDYANLDKEDIASLKVELEAMLPNNEASMLLIKYFPTN